jgi:hypothetical protein
METEFMRWLVVAWLVFAVIYIVIMAMSKPRRFEDRPIVTKGEEEIRDFRRRMGVKEDE